MKTPVNIPETLPCRDNVPASHRAKQLFIRKILFCTALFACIPGASFGGGTSCTWWQSGCSYNYSYDDGWLYDTHSVSVNCGGSTYDTSWIKFFGSAPDSGMCQLASSNGGSCSG